MIDPTDAHGVVLASRYSLGPARGALVNLDWTFVASEAGSRLGSGLQSIEVDLTPVLPGGDNGGAKTFALELLGRMICLNPRCRFTILTSEIAHKELAALDAPNVERRCVRADEGRLRERFDSHSFAACLGWLPHSFRRHVASLFSRARQVMMRRRIASALPAEAPDLLFCPFTATTYLRPGVPAVSTVHDLQYRAYPQFFSPEEQAHREAVFRGACRDASCIVAISEHTRAAVISTGLVEAERVRVIPHHLASRCARYQLPDAPLDAPPRPYLIYPANFWRHKNHEMLLVAFAMAFREGLDPDTTLLLTGAPGERQAGLTALCEAMGLQGRVIFAGHLPEESFAQALASATALIFPSLFEGFGMPVLEAMALGVPVACSRLAALPEVCGDAALMFDPRIPEEISNALVSITTDEALREHLIVEGRRRAAAFADGDAMALAYWRVFEETVARGASRDRFHGVYSDGWLSSLGSVEFRPATGSQDAELVLELEAPKWLPSPGPTLSATCHGRRTESMTLAPGTTCEWRIRTSGGRVDIAISPTFVPSRLGISSDERELTVHLRRCRVEYAHGRGTCVLWPQKEA